MIIPQKGAFGRRRAGLTALIRELTLGRDVIEVPPHWEGCHAVARRLGIQVATRRVASTNGTEKILVFRKPPLITATE
jgi:hypothetical protein